MKEIDVPIKLLTLIKSKYQSGYNKEQLAKNENLGKQ